MSDSPAHQKPPRILFLTLPERGQSNVHQAVIHSLLARRHQDDRDLDIHLGSYPELAGRVAEGVTFHAIEGKSVTDYVNKQEDGFVTGKEGKSVWRDVISRPGFFGYLSLLPRLPGLICPSGPEIVQVAQDVERVIRHVEPDLVVVDSIFNAAEDAVKRLGKKWMLLSPNTLKEVAIGDQGLGAFLWPITGIGFPFPMPYHLVPLNAICLILTPILLLSLSPYYRLGNSARHSAGYQGPLPVFAPRKVPILCVSTPALDLPGYIPPNVEPCGSILLPTDIAALQRDEELVQWIKRRPTVLVSLGSHLPLDKAYAQALLDSFKVLLGLREDVQVLWKLRKWGEDYVLDGVDSVDGDRLRIVDWLDVDPTSLLPFCVCVVNHGGSNSYHEALAAGTPQIILSPWADCHDFGVRAEWLGIGRWGNKRAAPLATQPEFTRALLDVIGRTPHDAGSTKIRQRAKELAEVIAGRKDAAGGKYGPKVGYLKEEGEVKSGRDRAADWILKYAMEGN